MESVMAFDFSQYIAQFNTLSEEEFCEKFYTEDLKVESQFGTLNGRDEWLKNLEGVHIGIKEELKPLYVVQQGDAIMTEVTATFTATEDKPDFMHGPLKKGESVNVRFFSCYHITGDKIDRLSLAWWDPKFGRTDV
jgi:SnoaL-like domain